MTHGNWRGRTIAFVVALLLFNLGVLSHSTTSVAQETLRIGMSPDAPPFESRDPSNPEKIVGFDIDMIDAVMGHLGKKYTISAFAFAGLIPAIQAGQLDLIISDMWINEERAKVLDFVTYQRASQAIITRAGNPLNITSMDTLCGVRAASKLGAVGVQKLQDQDKACQAAGKKGVTVDSYPDAPALLRAIDNQRTDAVMADAVSAALNERDNPSKYMLAFVTQYDEVGGIRVAVGVKKGNAELAELMRKGLAWYQESGAYDKAMAKWGIPMALKEPAKIVVK